MCETNKPEYTQEEIMKRAKENNDMYFDALALKKEEIPYPICPINMYFKGDEDKCNTDMCDFDTKTRSCSGNCMNRILYRVHY